MNGQRSIRIAVLIAAFAGSALASPVPPQQPGNPPPIAADHPVHTPSHAVPAVADPRLPLTLSSIHHRKPSAGKSTVFGTTDFVNDAFQDVEPSVIAIDKNGATHVTSVYFKYVNNFPNLWFSTTTDFASIAAGALPIPAGGYSASGDPLLAESLTSGGIAPGRVYVAALLFNFGPPFAIGVWPSDDGGMTWSQPTLVAQVAPGDTTTRLDKPAIGVSWETNSLGFVYVAYIQQTTTNQLFVARSTDGGATFAPPVLVASGLINGAQVLVNPFFGNVYVTWADYGANPNAIMLSRSTDFAQTWSAPEIGATGNLNLDTTINGQVVVHTLPMARFNSVANNIAIVWDEFNPATGTDVFYTSKSPAGWQGKVQLNSDGTSTDQFMPALDFDSTGNVTVTFYDRREDPGNLLFKLYGAHIRPDGTAIHPNFVVNSGFQSNPNDLPLFSGNTHFIGDYHDMWSWTFSGTEQYFPAYVGIQGAADIYVSRIGTD
jgi:hypothetical protein